MLDVLPNVTLLVPVKLTLPDTVNVPVLPMFAPLRLAVVLILPVAEIAFEDIFPVTVRLLPMLAYPVAIILAKLEKPFTNKFPPIEALPDNTILVTLEIVVGRSIHRV